jgi:hypothetical protein
MIPLRRYGPSPFSSRWWRIKGVDVVPAGDPAHLRPVHRVLFPGSVRETSPPFDDPLNASVGLASLRFDVRVLRAGDRLLPQGDKRLKGLNALPRASFPAAHPLPPGPRNSSVRHAAVISL